MAIKLYPEADDVLRFLVVELITKRVHTCSSDK